MAAAGRPKAHRTRHCGVDDGAMAAVDALEIAEGEHCAFKRAVGGRSQFERVVDDDERGSWQRERVVHAGIARVTSSYRGKAPARARLASIFVLRRSRSGSVRSSHLCLINQMFTNASLFCAAWGEAWV
jgi:hypothetical protein